jgi:hypothetical protein
MADTTAANITPRIAASPTLAAAEAERITRRDATEARRSTGDRFWANRDLRWDEHDMVVS